VKKAAEKTNLTDDFINKVFHISTGAFSTMLKTLWKVWKTRRKTTRNWGESALKTLNLAKKT